MRKFFLVVLALMLAAALILDRTLQSPRFWEYLFHKVVAAKVKDIELKEVHIVGVERHGLGLIFDIAGHFYGGTVTGTASIECRRSMPYVLDVVLKNVETIRLIELNAVVFSNIKGIVEGCVHLAGEGESIKGLKARLRMLPRGQVKAQLLQYLAQYLPQRRQIETMIKDQEDIPLDNAFVMITSVSERKFLYNINLYASKLNLKMNVDMDMNIEGGL
jgi:hypothetical protein